MSKYAVTTETSGESDYIPANGGIQDNYLMKNVKYEAAKKDGSGDLTLIFEFEGPNKEQFRHVEFPVDESREGFEKKYASLAKRIKHILNKYMPEEKVVLTGETFEQFAKGVIGLLGNSYKTIPVRVKLILNDSDRLGFPKYLPFIEKMDVNPSILRIGKDERIVPSGAKPTTMTPTEEAKF